MRRGFALVAVLWVISVAGALIIALAGSARTEALAARNRVLLARGRWAAEACAAIAEAAFAGTGSLEAGQEQLGRSVTCAWSTKDPAALLNVARAGPSVVRQFLEANGVLADTAARLIDTLMALRDAEVLTDAAQLSELPGFPKRLLRFVTVQGAGLVNPALAPPEVLAALPGFTPEAVARTVARRAGGWPVHSLGELAALLSPPARASLERSYADVARTTTFGQEELVLRSEGWVKAYGELPRTVLEMGVRPAGRQLVILWRRLR
jgi:hypothetical protein